MRACCTVLCCLFSSVLCLSFPFSVVGKQQDGAVENNQNKGKCFPIISLECLHLVGMPAISERHNIDSLGQYFFSYTIRSNAFFLTTFFSNSNKPRSDDLRSRYLKLVYLFILFIFPIFLNLQMFHGLLGNHIFHNKLYFSKIIVRKILARWFIKVCT